MCKNGAGHDGVLGAKTPDMPELGPAEALQGVQGDNDIRRELIRVAGKNILSDNIRQLSCAAANADFHAKHLAVYLDYTYYINILEDAYGC